MTNSRLPRRAGRPGARQTPRFRPADGGRHPGRGVRPPTAGGPRQAIVDGTSLDLHLRGGERPTLTVVVDQWTRMILGWHLA